MADIYLALNILYHVAVGAVAGAGCNFSTGASSVARGGGTATAVVVEMFIVAWVEKTNAPFSAGQGVESPTVSPSFPLLLL
jgi:hypothetical protein